MTTRFLTAALAAAAALATLPAQAHVGLSNVTTPISVSGQSTFAIANSTNEIVFNVPHGCTSTETVPALTGANLDTSKIEVTIPGAIVDATTVASLRPTMEGLFGAVAIGAQDPVDHSVKLTWTRQANDTGLANFTTADNHLYKVGVRLKVPNVASATDASIKKYQFLTVQYCKSTASSHPALPPGSEVSLTWGTANSPTLIVLPEKRRGFNKFTLDATTTAVDFTATSATSTLGAKLKSYFGDAAIVWVGKQGYSANPITATKIKSLVAKDAAYSELGTKAGVSIAPTDTIWVKY